MIIGLVGRARSGKDTVADILCREYGLSKRKFAGPLKAMLRALIIDGGCPAHVTDYWIEGAGKELPCPFMEGITPRHAMQTLGTQWGREHMGRDFWANQAIASAPERAVFSDCRFLNEAEAIRKAGGLLVRLQRPSVDILPASHASELELEKIACDYHLANIGTLENLAIATRFMATLYGCARPNPYVHVSMLTGIGK